MGFLFNIQTLISSVFSKPANVLSGDCSSLKETKRTGKMPIKKFRMFKIKAK